MVLLHFSAGVRFSSRYGSSSEIIGIARTRSCFDCGTETGHYRSSFACVSCGGKNWPRMIPHYETGKEMYRQAALPSLILSSGERTVQERYVSGVVIGMREVFFMGYNRGDQE